MPLGPVLRRFPAADDPVPRRTHVADLGVRDFLERRALKRDGDRPAWVVERLDAHAVPVLPAAVALRVVPCFELLDLTGCLGKPNIGG